MNAPNVDQRFSDLQARLQKLKPEDQERALNAFADVLTLCEIPPTGAQPPVIAVTLKDPPKVTTLSG